MHSEANTERTIERGGRRFLVEVDTSAQGWVLREFYRDGWPVMGAFHTTDDAVAYIDTLIEAGPLFDYEDEHGYQSCWV